MLAGAGFGNTTSGDVTAQLINIGTTEFIEYSALGLTD
jgi:hypothetical protein